MKGGSAPWSWRVLGRLWLAGFLLWVVATAPAFQGAWWFLDDYSQANYTEEGNIAHHLAQGRPGQLLWMYTFAFDGGGRESANIVLRLSQGAMHALVASLAILLIGNGAVSPLHIVGALPFLVWPYSAEATLWRSAGTYPLAALLSLLGLALVRAAPTVRRVMAAGLLVLTATFTCQAAACAAGVLWLLMAGLSVLEPAGADRSRLAREGALLAVFYAVGLGACYGIGIASAGEMPDRIRPTSDLYGELIFLTATVKRFLTGAVLYPEWLAALHTAVVSFVVVSSLQGALRGKRTTLVAGLGVIGVLLTPYAPLVLVEENVASWRTMYLSPLFFLGTAALVERAAPKPSAWRPLTCAAMVVLCAAYLWLGWIYVGLFPATFHADRRQLARFTREAARFDRTDMVIADPPDDASRSNDPYRLELRWGGPKAGALFLPYAARYFLRWYSPLVLRDDDPSVLACREACLGAPPVPGGRALALDAPRVLCVCPP
jgi:uncharacterized membrane protein